MKSLSPQPPLVLHYHIFDPKAETHTPKPALNPKWVSDAHETHLIITLLNVKHQTQFFHNIYNLGYIFVTFLQSVGLNHNSYKRLCS